MSDRDLYGRAESVMHKLFCRLKKAPPGATEVEVTLLEEADALISDLVAALQVTTKRATQAEDELRRKARAVQYRDRVIRDLRERLEEADALISDLVAALRRKARAVQYRDRVIRDLRER